MLGIRDKSDLPCSIYGDRIVINFLDPEKDLERVKEIIDLLEGNVGKLINLEVLRKRLCQIFDDARKCRYVLKAISNFYSIERVKPSTLDNLISFYESISEEYDGFFPLNKPRELMNRAMNKAELSHDDLVASSFKLHLINKIREPKYDEFLAIANYYILREAISMAETMTINFKCQSEFSRLIKFIVYRAKRSRAYIDARLVKNALQCEILSPYYYLPEKASRFYGRRFAVILANSLAMYKPWSIKAFLRIGSERLLWKLDSELPWAPSISLPDRARKDIPVFDSLVEKKIYDSLIKMSREYNCDVLRESTVIDIDGSLFIPDITIRCGARELYIEIVGFWTQKYISKKREKLMKLSEIERKQVILLIDSKLRDEFRDVHLTKLFYRYNKVNEIENKIREEIRKYIS